MESVSKLIAAIIIIAISLSLVILLSLWLTGIFASHTTAFSVRMDIIEGVYAVKTFFIDLRNTGSLETSITHVFINDEPAELVWAWDLTTNEYLGYKDPVVKPGHDVRIAIRSPRPFKPGSYVDVKIYTSAGLKLSKLIVVTGHKALDYINNGCFHEWNYNVEHMLAVYRDYYMLYGDQLPDLPRLSITSDWRSIRVYDVSFNMWYAFMNLNVEETIIVEIALTDTSHWEFIDVKALSNGRIMIHTTYDDSSVILSQEYLDPHRYRLVLKVYNETGEVELEIYIDDELVYEKNTTKIYGWYIGNLCIGVWDEETMFDLYMDKFTEYIDWIYYNDTRIQSEYNTATPTIFTSYRLDPTTYNEITSYPITLYDETIGLGIEQI